LYNDMAADETLATDVVQLIKAIDPNLKVMALAHSCVIDYCQSIDIQSISEGFADRRYQHLTQLRSRQLEGAVLHEQKEVLKQIQLFLEGKVQLADGDIVAIHVASICLHSDTKGAVELSKMIHNYLKSRHVRISAT